MNHHNHHHRFRHGAHQGRQGPGWGHHANPERGGGRRRIFESGELRLVLLKLTEEQPRHGYDLIRGIEALSGGAYAPSAGVVYPTMTLLLDMGLVDEISDSTPRKLFTITEAGQVHLAERAAELQVAMAKLQALADVRERTDAAPVRRAIQNLKAALNDRLSQEGVDKNLIFEVAGLIDEAAAKIERL